SSGNKQSRLARKPQYAITKHISFWHLTFNGQKAVFDHEQGAYYVAYLLLNPPDEPIHGAALEIKSDHYFGNFKPTSGVTEVEHPITGQIVTVPYDAVLEQRNLALDEKQGIGYLRRKKQQLEAILEDRTASEPVKGEVQRE